MKTLLELYDDRPLENVLATEMFRPERTVYICPKSIAKSDAKQEKLRDYFRHRGVDCALSFLSADMYNAENVLETLRRAVSRYDDCALDITGGTDAALFAGGLLCAEAPVPVFTYSRKRGRFFNIRGADFADNVPCDVRYNVEDCFLMAGGSMRMGRVDNAVLREYSGFFDPFFALYLQYRREWTKIVNFFQRISQGKKDAPLSLTVAGERVQKGERGQRISVNESAMRELEALGFLRELTLVPDVRFTFRDAQVRTWLRDIGSVLELYVYKACQDTGLFQDVRTSAVVDWEGDGKQNNVTNEIDVMACMGVTPVFISCKTCDVKTEALNELAILRDRFGGGIAKAIIVTAENTRAITRHRAEELGITVIDLRDLKAVPLSKRIREIVT